MQIDLQALRAALTETTLAADAVMATEYKLPLAGEWTAICKKSKFDFREVKRNGGVEICLTLSLQWSITDQEVLDDLERDEALVYQEFWINLHQEPLAQGKIDIDLKNNVPFANFRQSFLTGEALDMGDNSLAGRWATIVVTHVQDTLKEGQDPSTLKTRAKVTASHPLES